MLFEAEISEELMMLIYGFAILIIFYMMIALVLIIGHWKGKNMKKRNESNNLDHIMIFQNMTKNQ